MWLLFSFILGAIVGSFLNVAALRFNTGRSLRGRSACLSCNKKLGAADLIPLVSYFFNGGRCRYCGSRIRLHYPMVEGGTALLFLLLALVSPTVWHFLLGAITGSILIVIFLYDLWHRIIPDTLVLLLLFMALLFFALTKPLSLSSLAAALTAGALAALPLFLIAAISQGGAMGWGDVKLAFPLGAMLPLPEALTFILFSFWAGAIWSLALLCTQRLIFRKGSAYLTMKSEIPFAPYLIGSFLFVYLFHVDVTTLFL